MQSLSFLALQEPFTSLHQPNFLQRGVCVHLLEVVSDALLLCLHFP